MVEDYKCENREYIDTLHLFLCKLFTGGEKIGTNQTELILECACPYQRKCQCGGGVQVNTKEALTCKYKSKSEH